MGLKLNHQLDDHGKKQAFFNRRYIFIPWLVFPAIAMVRFFREGWPKPQPKVAWLSFLSIAGNGWPPKTGVPWGYPRAGRVGPGVVGDGWMFWEAGWRWLIFGDGWFFWRWLGGRKERLESRWWTIYNLYITRKPEVKVIEILLKKPPNIAANPRRDFQCEI